MKKEAKKRIKEVETQQINDKMASIEAMKNDSTRYFAALKELKSGSKQESLIVKDKEGKVQKKSRSGSSQNISKECWHPRTKETTSWNVNRIQ